MFSSFKIHWYHVLLYLRPQLRYQDVCKQDMKELSIDKNEWEELATGRSKWRSYLQVTLKVGEKI